MTTKVNGTSQVCHWICHTGVKIVVRFFLTFKPQSIVRVRWALVYLFGCTAPRRVQVARRSHDNGAALSVD